MRRIRALLGIGMPVALVTLAIGGGQSGAAPTAAGAACKKPHGKPIVVGSTLSLTGFLATSSAVHKVMGDVYLSQINKCGGLLGRPVALELGHAARVS